VENQKYESGGRLKVLSFTEITHELLHLEKLSGTVKDNGDTKSFI
jgi:hypothetical protein